MNIYDYQAAFGAADITGSAMKSAIAQWFRLYYQRAATKTADPCQRIAYTTVNKITKAVFSEYATKTDDPVLRRWLDALEKQKERAMQLALTGGTCYLKPCPMGVGFCYTLIPRDRILIFGRDAQGAPTDVGTVEKCTHESGYYTLLERRTAGADGVLRLENTLYRSQNSQRLGQQVPLQSLKKYAQLPQKASYPIEGIGLVPLQTSMLNCVDGSADAVAVFAAATELIDRIDENEAQLRGEFQHGQSRLFLSRDLLDGDKNLSEELFVGLDDDPERIGMTIFSPQLREQSFLARKQEYLRNVESVVGLKRGMLSEVNLDQRTATEIAASAGDFQLTVMDFQRMWETAVRQCMGLCTQLAGLYAMEAPKAAQLAFDWGNGVLYDEQKLWQEYLVMVDKGLIAPEVALGWRFGMAAETAQQRQVIRQKFMPGERA